MPFSSTDKSEQLGRLAERVDQTQERVRRLEEEIYGRKREGRSLALSWWQILMTGVFVLGGSLGGAALIVFLS